MRSFFRSMLIYRLTDNLSEEMLAVLQDPDKLNGALSNRPARDPASQELNCYGFDSAYPARQLTLSDRETPEFNPDEDGDYVERARFVGRGIVVVRARMSKRTLPGGGIKRQVEAKVREIEKQQMRKVYKKEKEQIKDEVIQASLPHALIQDTYTTAIIDTQERLILVDTGAPARAEDLLSTLRDCLGSLPVRPLGTKHPISHVLTGWVKQKETTNGFYLLDAAYLEDQTNDGATAKVAMAHIDVGGEEMEEHLSHGRIVKKIALAYEDAFGFVFSDKLILTKIRWEDLYEDQADKDGGEDYAGVLDASFLIQGVKYREFVADLLEAFGGEEIPAGL